jgi:hypothetical protein
MPRPLAVALLLSALPAQALPIERLAAVRGIDEFQGNDAERACLRELGFVVLPGRSAQMRFGYQDKGLPPFVTVDVAVHAVVVQQRALMRQIESDLAPVLVAFCERAFALAQARAASGRQWAAAARFVGLGRCVHGDGWKPAAGGELVAEAEGRSEPWTCLDPSAMAPGSAYHGDPGLERYFHARRWFGVRAFAAADPRQVEVADALAALLASDGELRAAYAALEGPFSRWLGPTATADLGDAEADAAPWRGLLPARLLPCARTLGAAQQARGGLPSPFDVLVVGALRSAAGQALLEARDGAEVAQTLAALAFAPPPPSLYADFLGALASVHEPLPAAAPPLFHTAAWQRRLCESQLAAWTTMYEVVAAHRVMSLEGRNERPVGRVAPYPQTFRAVAALARALDALVVEYEGTRRTGAGPLDLAERSVRYRIWWATEVCDEIRGLSQDDASARIGELVAKRARGEPLESGEVEVLAAARSDRIATRWALREVAQACDRLAAIARRQLASEELAAGDVTFLASIAEVIKAMHDTATGEDIPIVTRVASDGRHDLWLGTDLPGILYLVLDDHGVPTLYRGVVYTACGEVRPSRAPPFTVPTWLERVREGKAPRLPEFAFYRGR